MYDSDSIGATYDLQTEAAEQALARLEQLLGAAFAKTEALDGALHTSSATLASYHAAVGTAADGTDGFTASLQRATAAQEASAASSGARSAAMLGEVGVGLQIIQTEVGVAQSLVASAVAAEAHNHALAALGDAYGRVAQATNGAVSAEEALRARQELTQSGLQVTGQQLATITAAARLFARQAGEETPAMLERLTRSLERGSAQGLHRFGVEVARGTDHATGFTSAMAQLEERVSHAEQPSESLGEALATTRRELTELTGNLVLAGGVIGRYIPMVAELGAAFHWARGAIHDSNIALHGWLQEQGVAPATQAATADGAEDVAHKTEHVAHAATEATREWHALKSAMESSRATLQMTANGLEGDADAIERMIVNGRHLVSSRIDEMHRARAAADQLIHEHGGHDASVIDAIFGVSRTNTARATERLADLQARLDELKNHALDLKTDFAALDRHRGESAAHFVQREIHALTEANTARQHDLDERRHIDAEIERMGREADAKDRRHKHEEVERAKQQRRELAALNHHADHATDSSRDEAADLLRDLTAGATNEATLLARIEALRGQAAAAIRAGGADAHTVVQDAERDIATLGHAIEQNRLRNDFGHAMAESFGIAGHAAQSYAQIATGALASAAGQIKNHIQLLLEHKESAAAAFAAIGASELEQIGESVMARGLADVLDGARRIASSYGADPTGYALETTGVAEIALGAALTGGGMALGAATSGGGGGGSNAGGSGGGGGASGYNPARADLGASSGGGGNTQSITVNFGGPVWDRRGARDAVHNALRELQDGQHIAPILRTG